MNIIDAAVEYGRSFFGLDIDKPIDRDDLRSGFSAPRFATALNVDSYDPLDELYRVSFAAGGNGDLARPDGFAFLLEFVPQTGCDEDMAESLRNLFANLPTNTCLQASIYGDPHIHSWFRAYARQRGRPVVGERRAAGIGRAAGADDSRRRDMFARIARRRFNSFLRPDLFGEGVFAGKMWRGFLAVCIPVGRNIESARQTAISARQSTRSTLMSAGLPSWNCQPTAYINLIGRILNPFDPRRDDKIYDEGRTIREQIMLRDTAVRVLNDSIAVGGGVGAPRRLVAMSVSQYPTAMVLPAMGDAIGAFEKELMQFSCSALITLNIRLPAYESDKKRTELRSARALATVTSPMARLMPGYYRRQARDWNIANEAYANGGRMAQMSHQVLLMTPPDERFDAVENARNVFRNLGFQLDVCTFMQLQCGLAALPLSLSPPFADDLKTAGWLTHKTDANAAHSLPVLGEWRGTKNPVILLFGRRGQVMGLDLFDNEGGNYNAAIAGVSGSGKSVFLNEIASSYLARGARVWIIDVGRSYERVCEMLGGDFVEFREQNAGGDGIRLNPFTRIGDFDEELPMLKDLFAAMMSPTQQMSALQMSTLEIAIRGVWNDKKCEATPGDVAEYLVSGEDIIDSSAGADASIAADMATMLFPYTSRGSFGRFFDGPATIDFTNPFCVLELEELKNKRELQRVVLLTLLHQITQAMYQSRDQQKIVIIDEAWDLLGGEAGSFIETGYRRARKYNGAFICATQSVADFFTNRSAESAFHNSDWLILLRQKPDAIERMQKDKQTALTPAEKQMTLSLRTEPGRYSEMFVKGQNGAGVARFVADPFSLLLFSTTPKDYQDILAKRKTGMSVTDATDAVLAERGIVAPGR